jgi:hypothetical protein
MIMPGQPVGGNAAIRAAAQQQDAREAQEASMRAMRESHAQAGRPHEEQRNLGLLLGELGHKAMDGAVTGAAGYAVKKGLDKVFGDRHPDAREPPKQDDPGPVND